MCGRYALGVRMNFIRNRLQDEGMQVDEAPDDDEVRETYNFAPGNNGVVYRADTPTENHPDNLQVQSCPTGKGVAGEHAAHTHYKLQSMRWGLIPFWTKRKPDYGSLMRTINCRDDSLSEDRGMWTFMKRKKRCIVVCQGFYEWLKKGPGGKEKIPHFVRRKDGDLMFFAGLWDCVSYEDSSEQLYTYTVITTASSPYLKFLHDRMPVILEPNSEKMKAWLDPGRTSWTEELQSVLKPYEGELECYQVPKEVGKVGNNSPDFIVPVSSKENKSNIANFFANARKGRMTKEEAPDLHVVKEEPGQEKVKDDRATKEAEWSEDNAPKPVPRVKREHSSEVEAKETKKQKTEPSAVSSLGNRSPSKPATLPGKNMRSSTHNRPVKKTPEKKLTAGTQRITNFFHK